MADKPYPPFMRTVPVHAGDAERCREVGLMGGGALIMVFTLAWWIGDQYNPACNGTGDAASGPTPVPSAHRRTSPSCRSFCSSP